MELEGLFPLISSPGVQRDGTDFDGSCYTDALWCRFQRGRPRKIGGYRQIQNNFSGPSRGSFLDARNGYNYIYSGSANVLEMIMMDDSGGAGGIVNRTPAGFVTSTNNQWTFDSQYDTGSNIKTILAFAGQNLTNINSTVNASVYYGDANGAAALAAIAGVSVSGGVCVLPPYAFAYGNDGAVFWSVANTPTDFAGAGSGNARIAPNKVILGMRTRGGSGYSPAGLFWTLDELYRAYFVGGTAIWNFDYLGDTALLSPQAVVEYNGRYYWPDHSRFQVFNGAIEDLPNDMNTNYFYDNRNPAADQKIWGIKVPKYNEIWWFWAKGNATECTDVIIYNVKDKVWYDTSWSGQSGARSSGIYTKSFPYPLMLGLDANSGGKYTLYQHEFGVDRVEGSTIYAIDSYFETADISYCANLIGSDWVGQDRWVELMRIEPDFVQSGEMEITIRGRKYANSDTNDSDPFPFSSATDKIDMKEQRRELRLKVRSNVAGGDYQLGKTMLHMKMGDARQ